MRESARLMTLIVFAVAWLVGPAALNAPADDSGFLPVERADSPHHHLDRVVVKRGDHLWAISEKHLGVLNGRDVDDDEIAPYWRSVIVRNRNRLRSGEPDLIYPGETVVLPSPG